MILLRIFVIFVIFYIVMILSPISFILIFPSILIQKNLVAKFNYFIIERLGNFLGDLFNLKF